jgi:hypothetical protein
MGDRKAREGWLSRRGCNSRDGEEGSPFGAALPSVVATLDMNAEAIVLPVLLDGEAATPGSNSVQCCLDSDALAPDSRSLAPDSRGG